MSNHDDEHDHDEIEVPDNPVKKGEERLEHLRKDHTLGEHRAHIKEQMQDALEDTLFKVEIEEPEKQFVQDDYISIRIALEELEKERDMHEAQKNAWQDAAQMQKEAKQEADLKLTELKNKSRLYHLKKAFFP